MDLRSSPILPGRMAERHLIGTWTAFYHQLMVPSFPMGIWGRCESAYLFLLLSFGAVAAFGDGERYFTPPEGVNGLFPGAQGKGCRLLSPRQSTPASCVRSCSPFSGIIRRCRWSMSSRAAVRFETLDSCHRDGMPADIYLSASSDQLMRLVNEKLRPVSSLPLLALPLPDKRNGAMKSWRFTVEPAVFVFSEGDRQRFRAGADEPSRCWTGSGNFPPGSDRIGTYDIVESADGYIISRHPTSRQASLYGRVLEGLGRSDPALFAAPT